MRYARNSVRAIAAGILSFILFSCATTESTAYSFFTLNGMVYDHSGSAVNGMEIKLGPGGAAKSDYSGRFSFSGIKAGEHDFSAAMDGYETFSGKIRVSSPADIVYVSIYSLSDLQRSAQACLRNDEWPQALSFADRALAVEPADPRALFLKALILASRRNPLRDVQAASRIVRSMLESGLDDPTLSKFLSDAETEDASLPGR